MRIVDWNTLDATGRRAALARPPLGSGDGIEARVSAIIADVREGGGAALRAITERIDGVALAALELDEATWTRAVRCVPRALAAAIDEAAARIEAFHAAGAPAPYAVETAPGVRCERILRPIAPVGLYVPAGSAPLPSTVLMLAIPARLAGCTELVLCSPPRNDGVPDPVVLYAARRCGVPRVFALGGAQAIAAMAFGTETMPRCAKLFGPGNAWVTEAKRQVARAPDGPAIDAIAGPSEVLVVADRGATPAWIAADLLAQAEHGADSHAVLVCEEAAMVERVTAELARQLAALPRAAIAARALVHAVAIVVRDVAQALEVANAYAPEHLVLQLRDARRWLARVENAGSVFLGDRAAEALGDYCSGTNHVLPTHGHARAASGVSVASFLKEITVQSVDAAGITSIGKCAIELARAEGLEAHARAVELRLAGAGERAA